jgi:hypothetical protein
MAVNNNQPTAWVGWGYFAGFMMVVMGVLQSIAGLVALLNNEWLVVGPERLVALDFTTWGWVHLITGIVVLAAGFSLFHGATWARTVGVILASFSFIANLAYVNAYPIWSITIMVIDILIIYALTVHGSELRD